MKPVVFSEEYITRRLSETQHLHYEDSRLWEFVTTSPRPAAVLIPLFLGHAVENGEFGWQVLLTRRTNSVMEHQGQVAFPGGRADPADITPEMTALREAHEEIGLEPNQVRILGRMQSLQTITNYIVTPIVGVIPWPISLHLEETEVSRVFSIPLKWLADPGNHEKRDRTVPVTLAKILHKGSFPVIYFKPYNDEILWGVSAEITIRMIDILFNKKKAGD